MDIRVTSFMNAPLSKVAIYIKPKNCPVFKTQVFDLQNEFQLPSDGEEMGDGGRGNT